MLLDPQLWVKTENMSYAEALTPSLFTIQSLGINRNEIHFSYCKLVVSDPKFFFIASDYLYKYNCKH